MEELLKTIILGIIQGFTEFLPISSSGHLLIGRNLFGFSEAGLFFDTMLHLGTLMAVVIIFWNDIVEIIKRPFSKLTFLLVVGTIPAVIAALLFGDTFEGFAKSGVTLSWGFFITGVILWISDSKKDSGRKNFSEIRYLDAIIVGSLQAIAILPAFSRAGLTIAGSLFRGIHREDAARFSFLLSLPAILGAVVLQSYKLFAGEQTASYEAIGTIPLIVGTLAAAISGYVAVKWMLKIIKTGSLKVFSIYVWALGVIILILQLIGLW